MTTVYIDSILYSPKDYNSMYNYNQYNPFENKQNNILDIINTTKKDDVITGDECFIYKNPDGIQMPDGDIVHTLYVEMKNKHNTMNSASSATREILSCK